MKKTKISYGVAALFCASLSFAADAPSTDAAPSTGNAPNATLDSTYERDVQIARSLTEASRQATVVANLPLTEAQATAFWPVYREYRNDVAKQNDRFVQLVKQFSGDYDHMTDADAKSLVATYIDIAQKKLDLKKQYVKKFEKVLPASLVARAMQTEQKLDAMQDFTIARTIPLVPPATTSTGN
jgi:hypothetical protein